MCGWETGPSIKIDLREADCKDVNWIELA